jgi:hypothetical protein
MPSTQGLQPSRQAPVRAAGQIGMFLLHPQPAPSPLHCCSFPASGCPRTQCASEQEAGCATPRGHGSRTRIPQGGPGPGWVPPAQRTCRRLPEVAVPQRWTLPRVAAPAPTSTCMPPPQTHESAGQVDISKPALPKGHGDNPHALAQRRTGACSLKLAFKFGRFGWSMDRVQDPVNLQGPPGWTGHCQVAVGAEPLLQLGWHTANPAQPLPHSMHGHATADQRPTKPTSCQRAKTLGLAAIPPL